MHFCIVLAKKSGVRKHKGQAKIPYGHKKRSTAVLQPLLTLNLIL